MFKLVRRLVEIMLMLLGLTGLVDSAVVWTGFVADLVGHYQTVRDTVFGLLPFELDDRIKDYLIIGGVVGSSVCALGEFEGDRKYYTFATIFILCALWWPFVVFGLGLLLLTKGRAPDQGGWSKDVQSATLIFQNIGWALVLFVGFLFVASDALSRFMGG